MKEVRRKDFDCSDHKKKLRKNYKMAFRIAEALQDEMIGKPSLHKMMMKIILREMQK